MKVVDNILCLAWQDNNIVLALSNIHIVHTIQKTFVRRLGDVLQRHQLMGGLYNKYLIMSQQRNYVSLVLLMIIIIIWEV
jgi:uncharacterized membrane protein